MADFESTSVEMSEVAEPTEEVTGVEEEETAEPLSEEPVEGTRKTEEDAAWARMRREAEQARADAEAARRELEQLRAVNEAKQSTFSRLTGSDNGEITAIAEATGMSEDEVIAEMEAAEEAAQKDIRIAQLEEQVESIQAERLMQADLEALRKIDPSLRSLSDLGDGYIDYIASGLSPERAYWAVKAEELAHQATPPVNSGKIATGTVEKDYYTEAEIDAMSPEQLKRNYQKVLASWERNSKR